ncbi:DUF262 domain-containing protein [Photobacterium leiognathi]|uniref:DUF262 domain-containing protein n=1 Tax=Photobacterium leiognathi TaxID=553611 RepID=UPI002739FC12|nr:DUF262 domain-containing HNH endonuclease family protein [Photobacterium leiognathi]
MGTNLSVQTEILTLEKIYSEDYQFSIPNYQRPYVWSDDDVLQLFRDIKEACRLQEPNYFIGTVLSSRQERDGERIYELIDGQQRTTTLMLMTIAFKRAGIKTNLTELATYVCANNKTKPRLQFDIREQVQALLGGLAGLEGYQVPSDDMIQNNPYLRQMGIALDVLIKEVKTLKSANGITAEQVGEYLYRQVQWVNNIVPKEMDLNRLFATMNTAGIQLEQADILKAKLFKHIKTDKAQYDAIWVACEHLDNYFERNVRKVFPNADWNSIKPEHLAVFDKARFGSEQSETNEGKCSGLSIAQLAQQVFGNASISNTKPELFETYELDVETIYCRPIIKFPLLLIHAYRVFLALEKHGDISPRLHSDRLLEIFEPLINGDEVMVKKFMLMLWQVRYQFDRWVVKWVEHDGSIESQLRLSYQSWSKSNGNYYINRTQRELNEIVLLQSVRNFTGERSAQYWVTPFITKLIQSGSEKVTDDEVLAWFEHIDNQMSLAECTQKEASFALASDIHFETRDWTVQVSYFNEERGTSFEHYWFQKLEYLLWKKAKSKQLTEDDSRKFRKYRITSKNSVEHVYPQHHEYQQKLDKAYLDGFGNLVLLSPSENSSYSNQDVGKKLIDFKNKDHFDSLKLWRFFVLKESKDWKDKDENVRIEEHKNRMMKVFSSHYPKS